MINRHYFPRLTGLCALGLFAAAWVALFIQALVAAPGVCDEKCKSIKWYENCLVGGTYEVEFQDCAYCGLLYQCMDTAETKCVFSDIPQRDRTCDTVKVCDCTDAANPLIVEHMAMVGGKTGQYMQTFAKVKFCEGVVLGPP